jgi:UbiD family decarboxylase
MTSVRDHITTLEDDSDLARIEQHVHWVDHAPAVASEAARENGPAILFEDIPGETRLVSGAYGGPDQMHPRERAPWSRLAMALSPGDDSYEQLLSYPVSSI